MPNSINSLSPNFRDFLLNRNIISDTILSNGLDTLLQSVALPAEVSHTPEAVQPSEDIEVDGVFHKDEMVILNKYQGTDDDYEKKVIYYHPGNTNSTWGGAPYSHEAYYAGVAQLEDFTNNNVPANGPFNGGNIREFTTAKNNYLDVSKQTRIDFSTQPVPSYQVGSYLDEFGNLNVGGPDTQVLDIVGSLLQGGGVGFDPNGGGAVPDFDIRSSLAGRVLNVGGAIQDTRLGQLGTKYLASSIGNSIAMNLQEETLGRVNLNPLSLLKGNNIIVPNYNITVAKGTTGVAIDLLERMLGFEVPVSLLSNSSSIFEDFDGNYVSNTDRIQSMVDNTGRGQVLALIANLNENKYKPQFSDGRKKESTAPKGEDGTNGSLYAWNNGQGGITDLLHGSVATAPDGDISFEKEHGRITSELNGGFNDEFGQLTFMQEPYIHKEKEAFMWSDKENNKSIAENASDDTKMFTGVGNEKGILSKTKQLFQTAKMRTLTTGYFAKDEKISEIQTGIHKKGIAKFLMSKGSGVLSESALPGGTGTTDDKIFCRTWTTHDRYNKVDKLIRHSGLSNDDLKTANANTDASVLGPAGFVQIGPYSTGKEKYMFSIENLAWAGVYDGNLSKCEKGPGDPVTKHKGRIMWFPPYDLAFNESTSVNWERNNFIGRGEPVYTYNNSERTGTLSWKIVVDHPNYMNYFPKDWDDEEIASFYAGCLKNPSIRDTILTDDENNSYEKANNTPVKNVSDNKVVKPFEFNIFFKNDATDIATKYENGLINNSGDTNEAIGNIMLYRENTPGGFTGEGQGLVTTKGEGIVGGKGTNYNDGNNFGFNGENQKLKIPNSDNETIYGWQNTLFTQELKKYIKNECKYCRINITGYASQQGNKKKNQKLSELRAEKVKEWLLGSSGIIGADDLFGKNRVKVDTKAEGESSDDKCTGEAGQDRESCKKARKATIRFEYDAELKEQDKPSTPDKVNNEDGTPPLNIPPSRFFTECDYFKEMEQSSPTAYSSIKEKIQFFQPAFHSTTPEGFNSRLNFLNQCTRQGPTLSGNKPNNLAFGRPPVCILRLGDFYHTKIIIESLTVDYEPLVWDLNPEGVGVQPMIANVTISFAFIGGSSLNGPINKLQNAVSFNYYANTELYDPRADYIKNDGTLENNVLIPDPDAEVKKKKIPIDVNQTKDSKHEEQEDDTVLKEDIISIQESYMIATPKGAPYRDNQFNFNWKLILGTPKGSKSVSNYDWNIDYATFDIDGEIINYTEQLEFQKGISSKDYGLIDVSEYTDSFQRRFLDGEGEEWEGKTLLTTLKLSTNTQGIDDIYLRFADAIRE